MNYLFIDTNAFIVSCISTRTEHKVESFSVLKQRLKKREVKLLIPEVVKVEFERKIGELHKIVKTAISNLEEIVRKSKVYNLPILEEEKNRLTNFLGKLSKEKEERFNAVLAEIKELFSYENVEAIPVSGEIFIKAYIRCQKGKKPFKIRDSSRLKDDFDLIFESSIVNDALIVESLVSVCSGLHKANDVLVFCSENIDDFAEFDEKLKQHIIHPDISKDIPVKVKYYRFLPEMMRVEFKKVVVKERKDETLTLSDWLQGKEGLRSKSVLEALQRQEDDKRRMMKLWKSLGPSDSVLEALQRQEDDKREMMELWSSLGLASGVGGGEKKEGQEDSKKEDEEKKAQKKETEEDKGNN